MLRTATCVLFLALPAVLPAQQLRITPFTGVSGGLDNETMAGLALAVPAGPVGLRLSGAVDAGSTPLAPVLGASRSDDLRAWSGDLDMVLSGGTLGLRLGRVEPEAFVGVGVHGLRRSDGSTATIPVWSYGAGGAVPLTRWLSADLEARYRTPHESDQDQLPSGVDGGWEFRAGLSLRFGRWTRSPAPAVRSPAAPYPASRLPAPDTRPRPAEAAALASMTLQTADHYVGAPYTWGGDSPREGFDCSGFVQYVFGRSGIRLPRVSRDQARAGRRVDLEAGLREGDLLFFAGSDGVVDHVAIYAGNGSIIHAAESRGAVAYDRLDSRAARWYATHLVGVRRVISEP